MLYAKEGKLYTLTDIRLAHKNISFAAGDFTPPNEYVVVADNPQPNYDYRIQSVSLEGAIERNGQWEKNWVVKDLSQEEKQQIFDSHAFQVRENRNRKLANSDWTQGKDISDEVSAKWVAYRQALRDVTKQSGFPWDITWPIEPK